MIDSYVLSKILPNSPGKPSLYGTPLSDACVEFGINSAKRQAAFLAQIIHESNQLKTVEESLRYKPERLLAIFPKHVRDLTDAQKLCNIGQHAIANRVYANRMGNGDERSGDGWRYHGRGLIQLTGLDNYVQCELALGLPVKKDPDLLLTPMNAARSAAWFWKSRGLNQLADADMFEQITKKINGGLHGHEDRVMWWKKCKTAMGVA